MPTPTGYTVTLRRAQSDALRPLWIATVSQGDRFVIQLHRFARENALTEACDCARFDHELHGDDNAPIIHVHDTSRDRDACQEAHA